MNGKEFIHEVKNSELNYPEFDDEYAGFQKYQQLVLNTLKEFHRVCERNNIPYQLAYGSLLGAVRDNGQIPWDYDADVFVPYCERNKLIKALDIDLSDNYYYTSPEVDRKCRHFHLRLVPKGYRSEAIHVDVFYAIGAPDIDPLEFGKQVRRFVRFRFVKFVNLRMEFNSHSLKNLIKWTLRKIQCSFISISKIDREFHELCAKYDFNLSKNELTTNKYMRRVFNSKIWNTTLIDTSVGTFRIPNCYDEVLTLLYGLYSEVLPLTERIQEFRKSYKRLRYIEKNW